MKYILVLLFIFIFTRSAGASELVAYACDTCDSQGAQVLAKSYTPQVQCTFTNPPGTWPTPDDVDCYGPPAQVIVVNPLTQQAFKYRVQQMCQGNQCDSDVSLTHLTLSVDEQWIMATYYDIDSTMRSSIGQMSGMMALALSNEYLYSTNSASEQCPANPMDYFTNPTTQRNIEREIATNVSSKVGNRPWSEYITTNYVGPSSFQIGKGTANVTIDQKSVSQPAFERYFFGTDNSFRLNNNLNFRVNYLGRISDQPGVSTMGLQLIVDRSTSWVDGFRLSNLTPNGGTVDLSGSLDSMPCFKQFLESQQSEIIGPPVEGGGGGVGGGEGGSPLPGDDSSGWQRCPAETRSATCSTTVTDGVTTCTITIFQFLKPC